MKVTVSADGEVSFDTDSVDQAVEMVAKLRNGHAPVVRVQMDETLLPPAPKKKAPKPEPLETENIGPELFETWEWMVNDPSGKLGVSSTDVGLGLGITPSAAYYRLRELMKKGLVQKQSRLFLVQKGTTS